MSLIFLLIIAYFVIRAITRHSYYGPSYYHQMPPPPPGPGYGPGPSQQGYYGPPPGYGSGYGYGGWGPGYGGGGGFLTGLVGGLGGAWLGNEMFGQQNANVAPSTQVTTIDQSGNAIDPSSDPGGTPALGDGGGGGW